MEEVVPEVKEGDEFSYKENSCHVEGVLFTGINNFGELNSQMFVCVIISLIKDESGDIELVERNNPDTGQFVYKVAKNGMYKFFLNLYKTLEEEALKLQRVSGQGRLKFVYMDAANLIGNEKQNLSFPQINTRKDITMRT